MFKHATLALVGLALIRLDVAAHADSGSLVTVALGTSVGVSRTGDLRAYLALGEALSKRIDERGGAAHFERLISDRDNLLAVFRRAMDGTPRISQAARAALALASIALRQGPLAMSLELHGALGESEAFPGLSSH